MFSQNRGVSHRAALAVGLFGLFGCPVADYYCTRCCGPECGSSMPSVCLCLESFLCFSLAISATRNYVIEGKQLKTDPCDNRLIAFSNCLMILSCTSAPSPTL